MSDVRNWASFIRGRWDWSKFGYERGFPRGCQFTDIDASIEFDGRKLFIEAKSYDPANEIPTLSWGQRKYLESLVDEATTVLVVFGCGVCNDPYAVRDIGQNKTYDWRGDTQANRRLRLKRHIDRAMAIRPVPVEQLAEEPHAHSEFLSEAR